MNSLSLLIKSLQLVGVYSLILTSFYTHANHPSTVQSIGKLYHTLYPNLKSNMATRLDWFSTSFLGKPYMLGALGEGPSARYDQSPLYRVDGFDCMTYVETVLALALAENQQVFKQCINNIRYRHGEIDFLTRNHFTSLDWNLNNQQQNFIKDITFSITNPQNKPILKLAVALIDKPSWYEKMSSDRIKLFPQDPEKALKRLSELRVSGTQLPKAYAKIPYLPLTALFDEKGIPNEFLFAQIPNASIIEIVRPNWDLTQQIGTHLNVSHLGFAFWKNGILVFRQASSTIGKVVEVPLIDYLKKARTSPTIKGINVQIVVPTAPLSKTCSNP